MFARHLRLLILGVLLVVAASGASAAQQDDPGAFLKALSEAAIEQLGETGVDPEERQQRFTRLLEANFDMPAISRFVLGVHARKASEAERAEFLEVFKEVLSQRFLPYFHDQQGEAFAVDGIKPDPTNPKLTMILSKIVIAGDKTLPVAWRVRKSGDSYKIFDVVAEGVSLAITFRSEYAAVLKRSGGDVAALTADLRSKLERGGFAPATN